MPQEAGCCNARPRCRWPFGLAMTPRKSGYRLPVCAVLRCAYSTYTHASSVCPHSHMHAPFVDSHTLEARRGSALDSADRVFSPRLNRRRWASLSLFLFARTCSSQNDVQRVCRTARRRCRPDRPAGQWLADSTPLRRARLAASGPAPPAVSALALLSLLVRVSLKGGNAKRRRRPFSALGRRSGSSAEALFAFARGIAAASVTDSGQSAGGVCLCKNSYVLLCTSVPVACA